MKFTKKGKYNFTNKFEKINKLILIKIQNFKFTILYDRARGKGESWLLTFLYIKW